MRDVQPLSHWVRRTLCLLRRYGLPEVDDVLSQLVREVAVAAAVAAQAAADPRVRARDMAAAAAVAAEAAGPGGAAVYEAWARHGSVRLLAEVRRT